MTLLKGLKVQDLQVNDRLTQLVEHQAPKPVIINVKSIPTGGKFNIFLLKLLYHHDVNIVQKWQKRQISVIFGNLRVRKIEILVYIAILVEIHVFFCFFVFTDHCVWQLVII